MNRRTNLLGISTLTAAAASLALGGTSLASNVSAPACVATNYVANVLPENATPSWTLNGNDSVCCNAPATYGQSCNPSATQCDQIVSGELVVTKSGDLPSSDHSLFYLRQDCSLANASSITLTSQAHFHPDVPTPDNGNDPSCPTPPDSLGPNDNQRFYGDGGVLVIADGTKIGLLDLDRVTDPRFGAPGTGPFNTFIGIPNMAGCGPRNAAFNFLATAPLDTSVTHNYQLVLRPGIDFSVFVDSAVTPVITVPYSSLPSSSALGGISGFAFASDRGVGFFDFVDTSVCGGSCPGQNCGTAGTPPPGVIDAHGNCTGTVQNATFSGDLKVPDGATCTLSDVLVQGNVTEGKGSTLTITGGSVQGNVQAHGSASLTLGSDTCGGGASIKNDVQTDTTTSVHVTGAAIGGNLQCQHGGSVAVSGAGVHNDMQIQQNSGPISVASSTVGNNLQLQQNAGGTTCSGNTVSKNIQIQSNTGGVTVTGNTWGGSLQCQSDTPNATGQCNM